jgi:hypothetical protein
VTFSAKMVVGLQRPFSLLFLSERNIAKRNITESNITERNITERNITERNITERNCLRIVPIWRESLDFPSIVGLRIP